MLSVQHADSGRPTLNEHKRVNNVSDPKKHSVLAGLLSARGYMYVFVYVHLDVRACVHRSMSVCVFVCVCVCVHFFDRCLVTQFWCSWPNEANAPGTTALLLCLSAYTAYLYVYM